MQNVVAVGEAGLDKVCTTDFVLQQTVFSAHIQLANELQKPLIVHCVRAHAEAMQLLKKNKVKVPVLFHGFTKSKELALQLMAQGYYLSFGHGLMKNNLRTVFAALPLDQLLSLIHI